MWDMVPLNIASKYRETCLIRTCILCRKEDMSNTSTDVT
jgi:hypothetical protein